ncbi:MAG TPA: hypothetical protein VIH24_05805 [Candidatus Limnocylindria bacterium]
MKHPLLAMAVVALLAVVGVAAFFALGPRLNIGSGPVQSPTTAPTDRPSPTAGPTPAPLDTTLWATYSSSQYGFPIGHPADWDVEPAERAWDLDRDAADWLSPAMDDFTSPTGDVRVSVWAVPTDVDGFAPRSDVETWIEEYCGKTGSGSCAGILDGAVPMCVEVRDCHPGVLVGVTPPFEREVQAFFTGGEYAGQMVVVTVWRAENDPSVARYGGARRLIEAFLLTMCVSPDDTREPFPCGG